MSEVSKNELKYDNSVSFPNNNNGAITPSDLRTFNVDLIDSTVNQTLYNSDSASFYSKIVDANAEINSLELFTASQDNINSKLATTGSNYFEGTQTITGDVIISNGDIDVTINASTITDGLVINSNLNVEGNLNIDGTFSASLQPGYVWLGGGDGRVQAVPSSSLVAGGSTDIDALNQFTASQEVINSGYNAFTASQQLNDTQLNSFTSSQETKNTTLGIVTASLQGQLDSIGLQSGSWVTESETGSFARVNVSNQFTETQNITGDLNVTGTINATTIHTIIESSSVIFSSGSNILGDSSTEDTQTLNGVTSINGNTTITGNLNQTNGNVTITGSISQQGGNTTLNGNLSVNGGNVYLTPLSVSANGAFPIPFISASAVSKDSVDTLVYNPTTNQLIVSASTGQGVVSPNVISFTSGSGAYGTYVSSMSKFQVQSSIEGSGVIGMSGNPSKIGAPSLTTSTNPGILALSGSGVPYVAIELQPSASFTDGRVTIKRPLVLEQGISSSIIQNDGTNTFNGATTINADTIIGNGGTLNVGGQIIGNNSLLLQSENAGVSIQKNSASSGSAYTGVNIKVDNTTDPTNVYSSLQLIDDQSGVTLALAWNSYTGLYANSTPMIVANQFYNGSDAAIAFPNNTIDIWKPSTFKAPTIVTGSVRGNVVTQSITSNTASLDFGTSNFFEVTLTSGVNTRVEATNVQPGQTINLLVKQPAISGTGTISFSNNFDFPAVAPYTASVGDSKKDIVTFITFSDTGSIYSVGVKNLI